MAIGCSIRANAAPHTSPGHELDNLVIPEGATALFDDASSEGLKICGKLTNYGRIICRLHNAQAKPAVVEADEIFNAPSGIISCEGSDAASLTVRVAVRLKNEGLITSEGSLSITSPTASVSIDNTGGVVEAVYGAIEIGTPKAGDLDIAMSGGRWISQQLNVWAGEGTVTADLGEVTGLLHTEATQVWFGARTPQLRLAHSEVAGDPLFFNQGDITIDGDIKVAEDLAILASGNITGTAALKNITTQDANGRGHNIFIVAGAKLVPSAGSGFGIVPGAPANANVTLDPTAPSGGDIDLSASPGLVISSASSAGGFPGANVSLVAFANGTTGGRVLLATKSLINASGANGSSGAGGAGGIVEIVAGAPSGTTITVGTITAKGGNGSDNTSSTSSTGYDGGDEGIINILALQPMSCGSGNVNFALTFKPDGSMTPTNGYFPACPLTRATQLTQTNAAIVIGGPLVTDAGSGSAGNDHLVALSHLPAGDGGTGGRGHSSVRPDDIFANVTVFGGRITINGNVSANAGASGNGASAADYVAPRVPDAQPGLDGAPGTDGGPGPNEILGFPFVAGGNSGIAPPLGGSVSLHALGGDLVLHGFVQANGGPSGNAGDGSDNGSAGAGGNGGKGGDGPDGTSPQARGTDGGRGGPGGSGPGGFGPIPLKDGGSAVFGGQGGTVLLQAAEDLTVDHEVSALGGYGGDGGKSGSEGDLGDNGDGGDGGDGGKGISATAPGTFGGSGGAGGSGGRGGNQNPISFVAGMGGPAGTGGAGGQIHLTAGRNMNIAGLISASGGDGGKGGDGGDGADGAKGGDGGDGGAGGSAGDGASGLSGAVGLIGGYGGAGGPGGDGGSAGIGVGGETGGPGGDGGAGGDAGTITLTLGSGHNLLAGLKASGGKGGLGGNAGQSSQGGEGGKGGTGADGGKGGGGGAGGGSTAARAMGGDGGNGTAGGQGGNGGRGGNGGEGGNGGSSGNGGDGGSGGTITLISTGGSVTLYTLASVDSGSAGQPGGITAPAHGGNGGAGGPGGTGGNGGGHGPPGNGPGGTGRAGLDGTNGISGTNAIAGTAGLDGQPGTPGNAGHAGQSGTIKGGTIMPAFGVAQLAPSGQFTLAVNGPPGTAYIIQGSSNLVTWTPILTNTAPFTFSDLVSAAFRFYRITH